MTTRGWARTLCCLALCALLAGCTNLGALEALIRAQRYEDTPLVYTLRRDETLVRFEAGTIRGRFRVFDGRLGVTGATIEGSKLSVTIATASVSVANPLIEQVLRGDAWFASKRYPLARFASTKVRSSGYPPLLVRGPFTLRGVTRELTLRVRFSEGLPDLASAPERIAFEAETTLSRSAFGMRAMPDAAPDEVTIEVRGTFVRQGGSEAPRTPSE